MSKYVRTQLDAVVYCLDKSLSKYLVSVWLCVACDVCGYMAVLVVCAMPQCSKNPL